MQPYRLVWSSRRRTLSIEIKFGEVIVRSPKGLSESYIEKFVQSRQQWIQSILSKGLSLPRQTFESGFSVLISGMRYQVEYFEASAGYCTLKNGHVLIGIPKRVTNKNAYALKTFDQWLLTQAQHSLPETLKRYLSQLDVDNSFNQLVFKKTKTKWGHCTSKGEVQLNPRILMAPTEVQCYLIAHEVAHLREMNHSKSFWRHVAYLDPNFKLHRAWLKTNQHETIALIASA